MLVVTLVGGAFAAGSANTINCYIDRDIDAAHAAHRPAPADRHGKLAVIKPAEALAFGIVLGAVSTVLLGTLVNWLSAGMADAAILFYVLGYTIGLKRRTASNIVWGGAAGCMPVLIGWAAVTHTLDWPAGCSRGLLLDPATFWALALRFRDDYAAVGVPMLRSWPPRPRWPARSCSTRT